MNTFEEYAIIESKISELNEQKEVLRAKIMEEMLSKGEKKVGTSIGSFSVSMRKIWTYPEKVLEIGEKFKEAKAKSESTGEATFTEEPSLRFTKVNL